MSEADIETLRAAFEAASRGDWDVLLRVTHPDFELKTTLVGTHRGQEKVRRFLEDRWEAFEETVVEPEEFLQVDDRIVVRVLMRARPRRGTSAVLEIRNGQLWTMRDGKAARCETFPRFEEALEAAGLAE
jgi:ketosteroid isomerase-like protein